MPSGKTLGIGLGIKRGTNSFLQNFYQAKQFEMQDKQQKNGVILQALMSQLSDDNIPLFERARILDAIPNLVGAKLDRPLSETLNLHKYNEQLVEDPNQPAQIGQAATKGDVLSSDTTGSPNEGQTLPMRGQAATQDVPAGQTERGNLNPNQLKMMLVRAQNKAADEGDVTKQLKILEGSYKLQNQIFGKGGYTERLPFTFDEDKNLIARWRRPSDNDIRTVNLGKSTTEGLEKMNAGLAVPKGKFGQLTMAHQIITSYEADPTSFSTAQYKGAKDLVEEFERNGNLTEAKIESFKQNIYGNPPKPITPSQNVDDERARQQMQIQLQTSADNAEQNAIQSSERASSAAQARTNFYEENVKPALERRNAAHQAADGDTADGDYIKAEREYNRINSVYLNGPAKDADLALATDNRNKAALKNAQNRLGEFGKIGKVSTDNIGPIAKAYIDKYFGGDTEIAKIKYKEKFKRELDITK